MCDFTSSFLFKYVKILFQNVKEGTPPRLSANQQETEIVTQVHGQLIPMVAVRNKRNALLTKEIAICIQNAREVSSASQTAVLPQKIRLDNSIHARLVVNCHEENLYPVKAKIDYIVH